MVSFTLKAEKRKLVKTNELKKLRKEGLVPVNYYGYKLDNESYFVDAIEAMKALKSGFKVITLQTEAGDKQCVVREIQRHPVTWDLTHIDFLALQEGRKVNFKIPLKFEGISHGVKNLGGVLLINSRSLEISCLPEHIVNELVFDVSKLKLKETIHANDVNIENIEVVSKPSTLLCSIGVTRAALSIKNA